MPTFTQLCATLFLAVTWSVTSSSARGAESLTPKNSEAARVPTTVKAEQTNPQAQYDLGVAYMTGNGVNEDQAEAMKWFRKAADQNHAEAQYVLGHLFVGSYYKNGSSVPRDTREAVKWFHKAAEQGHVGSYVNLGMIYFHGKGVERDVTEAIKWFYKASEKGEPVAQFNLWVAFSSGASVPIDNTEAYKWILLAAATNDTAKKYITAYESRLSPEQRIEGAKLAQEFKNAGGADRNRATHSIFLSAILGDIDAVKASLERGVPPNAVNSSGTPLIFCAAASGSTQLFNLLVSKGAKLDQTNSEGSTVLFQALASKRVSITEYLINNKCDINAKNAALRTPLHIAAQYGDTNDVRALLERKALADEPTKESVTPLMVALLNNKLDVAELIANSTGRRMEVLSEDRTLTGAEWKARFATSEIPTVGRLWTKETVDMLIPVFDDGSKPQSFSITEGSGLAQIGNVFVFGSFARNGGAITFKKSAIFVYSKN